jgi:hypothetical protein
MAALPMRYATPDIRRLEAQANSSDNPHSALISRVFFASSIRVEVTAVFPVTIHATLPGFRPQQLPQISGAENGESQKGDCEDEVNYHPAHICSNPRFAEAVTTATQ